MSNFAKRYCQRSPLLHPTTGARVGNFLCKKSRLTLQCILPDIWRYSIFDEIHMKRVLAGQECWKRVCFLFSITYVSVYISWSQRFRTLSTFPRHMRNSQRWETYRELSKVVELMRYIPWQELRCKKKSASHTLNQCACKNHSWTERWESKSPVTIAEPDSGVTWSSLNRTAIRNFLMTMFESIQGCGHVKRHA